MFLATRTTRAKVLGELVRAHAGKAPGPRNTQSEHPVKDEELSSYAHMRACRIRCEDVRGVVLRGLGGLPVYFYAWLNVRCSDCF